MATSSFLMSDVLQQENLILWILKKVGENKSEKKLRFKIQSVKCDNSFPHKVVPCLVQD